MALKKCISLSGADPIRHDDSDPTRLGLSDYRLVATYNSDGTPYSGPNPNPINKTYIDATSSWVKVWINWNEEQGDLGKSEGYTRGRAPVSLQESWDYLNQSAHFRAWIA